MNELYAEAYVKRKEDIKSLIIKGLMVFGILLGFFVFTLGGFISIVGIIIMLPLIYLFPKLNVEYEYIFVDGQLDFDKIMGKSKRKQMLRINFEQVEIMAPINSHSLDGYNSSELSVKDFSSRDKEAKAYVIIVKSENKKLKVIFEPSDKMIDCIKQKSFRKLVTY